jgi:hypothetical protein
MVFAVRRSSGHPPPGMQTAATSSAKLDFNGKQNEKGELEMFLQSERSGSRLQFKGKWVADL